MLENLGKKNISSFNAKVNSIKSVIDEITNSKSLKSLAKERNKIDRLLKEIEELHSEKNSQLDELRTSNNTLKTFFMSVEDLVFVHPLSNENGFSNFTSVNKAACKKLGYTEKELLQHNPVTLTHPDDHELIPHEVEKIHKVKKLVFERKLKKKNGGFLLTEINSKLVEINGNHFVIAIARDISERKKFENELKSKNMLLESAEITAKLGSWENDYENNVLTWSNQTYEIFELNPKAKIKFDQFIKKVHHEDRPKLIEAQKQLRENKKEVNIEYRIRTKDDEIKYIQERGHASELDDSGRVKKTRGFVQDITENKLLLEEVRKNEQTLNTILTSTDDIIYTLDEKQRHTSVYSKKIEQGLINKNDFIGKSAADLFGKEKAKIHIINNKRALKGENVVYDWSLEFNGNTSFFQTSVSPLYNHEYKIVGIVGIGRDITNIRENELKLIESEDRYKNLFEKSSAVMLLINPETEIIEDANNEAIKYYEYSRNELIGKKITEINILPEEKIKEEIQKVHTGEKRHFEFKHRLSNGEIRDVEVYAGHFDANKKHLLYSIIHDISDRKLYEDQLIESEKRFKVASELSSDFIYEWNFGEKQITWVGSIDERYGYESGEFPRDIAELTKRIHKEDIDSFTDLNNKFLNNEVALFDMIYRIKIKNNNYRYWHHKAQIINSDGERKKVVGTCNDITDKVLSEHKLKESEENFRLLFERMHDGFALNEIVTDSNNNPIDYIFRMVNPAFEKETGLNAESILNKKTLEVIPETEKYWIQEFGRVALEGVSLNYKNYSKAFNKTYETVVFQPKPRFFAVFFWDVTEQEKQRIKLEQSEENLRSITDNTFDLISKVDSELKISFLTPSHEVLLGYSRDVMLGRSILEFIHPDDRYIIEELLPSALRLESIPLLSIRVQKKDGSFIWSETSTRLIIEDNKFAGAVFVSRDITQKYLTEEGLRKLKRAIDQSSSSVVITNKDGKIEFVNPRFTEVTGYSEAEAIGENPRLLKSNFQNSDYYKEMWETISKGLDWKGEFLNKRKDGTEFWESATISPIKDSNGDITHYVAIKDDITETKKMQEELDKHRLHLEDLVKERTEDLNRQNKFLQTLLDTIPNPVFVKNLKGEYIILNKSFLEEIKTDGLNPIGKTVYDLYEINAAKHYAAKDDELLKSGKPQSYEYLYYSKDGKAKACMFYKNLIKNEEKILGIIGVVVDISERKSLEIQTKQALEKEQEWNELQKHLISMVSHEFRTPLTSILSSADFLEMFGHKISKDKMNSQISRIQLSVQKLTSMIEDVLTISRVDRGKLNLSFTTFNLNKTLNELIDEANIASSNSNNINLHFNLNEEEIYFDEKIIHHIISNLLSNATKYSKEGGKIHLFINKKFNNLIIKVADEGIGIPEKDIAHLFSPFARATNTQGIDGHGLGLAIIKKFVDMVEGKYEVESKINEGTTFTIFLPMFKSGN